MALPEKLMKANARERAEDFDGECTWALRNNMNDLIALFEMAKKDMNQDELKSDEKEKLNKDMMVWKPYYDYVIPLRK